MKLEPHTHAAHQRLCLPSLTAAEVLELTVPVIDLRSPAEFADDHLPGAKNRPLFDNGERALVGTLYRQASPERAYAEGLEITRAKIARLVADIACDADRAPCDEATVLERMTALAGRAQQDLQRRFEIQHAPHAVDPGSAFVVHCWRGGLRSMSVCALLRDLGFDAWLLEGGYKAYRAHVLTELSTADFPPAIVLRGLTGVGKTLVLRELERLLPGLTVDLEGLAEHRSSILGAAGLEPVTQKTFDSRLLARHRAGYPHQRVAFEGESRKVGDVILPARLWSALRAGVDLELTATTERRVQVLVDDYLAHPESGEHLRSKLPFLEERMGRTKYKDVLVDLFDAGRIDELVELLLLHYYDPLYRHSEPTHSIAASLDASNPAACAARIRDWLRTAGN